MLYSYATKWIGGFSLMCATQSCRATLMTSLPSKTKSNGKSVDFLTKDAPQARPSPRVAYR